MASNIYNTEFNSALNSVVGFTIHDLTNLQPFETTLSTVWFAVFLTFIGTVFLLIGIAFFYSVCDCLCSCCGGRKPRKGNKVRGHDNIAMGEM